MHCRNPSEQKLCPGCSNRIELTSQINLGLSIHFFPFSAQYKLIFSSLPVLLLALLFDELLYTLKVQYILSNVSLPLLLTGMRNVHTYLWAKHGPKTVHNSRIYMLYIPQKHLQIYCPSLALRFSVWLHLPCCVLGRAVSWFVL